MRAGEAPPDEPVERSTGEEVVRQAGLTARHMGPMAVGAAAGAAMGAPIGGVGAVPGAAAGAAAMGLTQLVDALGGTNYVDKIMDKLGLPRAEGDQEKFLGAVQEALASFGGVTGAAKTALRTAKPTSSMRPTLEAVVENPGMGAVATASGAAAGEAAEQEGASSGEKFAAEFAGSLVAPAGVGAMKATGRAVGGMARDVAATFGAGWGHKASVDALASDVVKELTKETPGDIRRAVSKPSRYIRGAPTTVGEALAEANLKDPTKQIGGAAIKMQEELAGAKKIEDFFATVMKKQDAAVEAQDARLQARTGPMRQRAIQQAEQGMVNAMLPIRKMNIIASQPGVRSNKGIVRALEDISKEMGKAAARRGKTGQISPEDLISLRGQAGKLIEQRMAAEGSFDQATAVKALKAVKTAIDDEIEQAGAAGWKKYLDIYSKGKLAQELQAGRWAEVHRIAGETAKRSTTELVKEELPTIPTLLHRPTMAVNFALKLIGQSAVPPVERKIAQALADPKEFVRLMDRPASMPARKIAYDVLVRAGALANLIADHQRSEAEGAQP